MKDHIEEITLTVVLLEDGDDWSGWCLENPLIASTGKDKEEVKVKLTRAIKSVLRGYKG